MTITLGGVEVKSTVDAPQNFSMLLWGQAKSGKTTLASTAPGKKLWINFDPDGTASLTGRDDIMVADYANEKHHVIIPKLLNEDPINLGVFLKDNPDIETVVIDSVTLLAALVQAQAVKAKNLAPEEPGMRGYGVKNNWLNIILRNLIRVVKEQGRNVILIAHESAPDRDDKGTVVAIGLALSESIAVGLSALPSEVWHVSDDGGKRRIAVRPCRQRSPMGTRMFIATGDPEFYWKYDATTRKGEGIADWFNKWREKGDKIPIPS